MAVIHYGNHKNRNFEIVLIVDMEGKLTAFFEISDPRRVKNTLNIFGTNFSVDQRNFYIFVKYQTKLRNFSYN